MKPYEPKVDTDESTKMKPVFTSSEAAKALADPNKPKNLIFTAKYPWRDLEVGQSFHVATGEANWTTISTSCYKWSKKLNKVFRAINHKEQGIEVARLPDTVGKV